MKLDASSCNWQIEVCGGGGWGLARGGGQLEGWDNV